MADQPEALRLADVLEHKLGGAADEDIEQSAAELRRLHEKCEALTADTIEEMNRIVEIRWLALRGALRQALEFCENVHGGCTDSDDGTVEAITVWCPELIDALRAALAEPVRTRAEAMQDMVATSEQAGLYELTAEPVQPIDEAMKGGGNG